MVRKPDRNLILITTSQMHRAAIDAIISHGEADKGHVNNVDQVQDAMESFTD